MMRRSIVAAVGLMLAAAALPARAAPGIAGHTHDETYSAGQPGDPKGPARVVLITMREGDGKMAFMPNQLEGRRGEQIRFVLRNNGELEHEFVLATIEENTKHAEQMRKNPDMEHANPNGVRIQPKGTTELVWRFNKSGQFEFACLIPGHREIGMVGQVAVK